MKTNRTLLSLALLLSMPLTMRAMDPAAESAISTTSMSDSADGASERAASPLTTTGKQLARELELKTKITEYQAALKIRRSSLQGHETILAALAAQRGALAEASTKNTETHEAELAGLQGRRTDLENRMAERRALIEKDMAAETERFTTESQRLAAELAALQIQQSTKDETVANRLARIKEVEAKEREAQTRVERLAQGLPEKSGLLGLGTYIGL